MANERENPDTLILETFGEVAAGKATIDDLQAAMLLCLELPWKNLKKRAAVEHLSTCRQCLMGMIEDVTIEAMLRTVFPGARVERVSLGDLSPRREVVH